MIQRLFLALICIFIFSPVHAFESCQEAITYFQAQHPDYKLCNQGPYGDGYVCEIGSSYYPPETGCAYPIVQTHYIQCAGNKVLDQSTGTCSCPVGTSWNTVANWCTVNDCPSPQVLVNGQCVDPPPDPQDCVDKGNECASTCGGTFEAIAYFYCETSTASDPSTQLFHTPTYKCNCGITSGCPTGEQQITSINGTVSCAPSALPQGCPQGSYYGDFNGQTGCISPTPHNDPDETPNNCIQGMGGVYFGSTLYCVPPKDTTTCPTGTSSFVTETGLKICKGTDTQGNSTGDSPDTNGSIKGTPVGGNNGGTGSGSGTDMGSGSGTGSGGDGGTGDGDTTGDKGTLTLPSGGKKTDFGAFKAGVMAQYERAKTAPIMGVGAQISTAFNSSGSCPQIAFDFFGSNITTTLHCQVFDSIKSYFSAFMYAAWAILALMVFRRV